LNVKDINDRLSYITFISGAIYENQLSGNDLFTVCYRNQ